MIYTLPILLVAVLGCLYLHLGKQMSENSLRMNWKSYKFGRWRRPMIIKGLGIVCLTEVIILIMFLALLIWSFSFRLYIAFSEAKQHAPHNGDKLWEVKWEKSGLILGLVGNICLSFLFFPVTRGSSILPLFGLTSEGSIKYHIWLGHITMLLFTLHGSFYIIIWIFTNQIHQMLVWDVLGISHVHGVSNVAGELALLFGLLLWIATYPSIKKKMFELFFYTHHLYTLFMVFYIFHLGFSFSYSVIAGFYLFLVDRYLRFLQSRQRVSLISARVLPCETVELNFCKTQGLSYTPTSMIFIQVAKISKLQWHPFTISSNSNLEPKKLSVIIKSEGAWTKQLYHLLNSSSSPNLDYFNASIEGPYGPLSTHFLRHDMLVFVSGGSGISPFISIIKELIFLTTNKKIIKSPQILLISAFKHSLDLTMLDLLPATLPSSNFELQIEAFVTREKEPPLRKPQLRTLWFNPSPSSAPLSPTLGPSSWLWLSAIISSSFIFFLVLNGIITRYYIYPIDKNTNMIFSHSSQALFYMLLLCVSILVSASIGFLWNKKHREIEEKHEENNERFGEERELESFPNQCLEKCTKVHYVGRPDLKKFFLKRDEPSIGVLVSGPRSMRHEVAAICSSGSAKKLHFESINYNW